MNICTIIAKNYVAHARVLANSFRRAHPDGTCTVLVVDDADGFLDPAAEPFELLGIDEIGLPDPVAMAADYDVTEFSTAVKPWLLRHLLARDGVEAVTYLDPDIWIADEIDAVDRLAREHGVVLTPHFTKPLPRDGLRPSEEDILIAGAYNLGFISLGAGSTAEELLDWWSERLAAHCVVDPANGLFVDQRWIDLVPGIWEGVHVLRDPAYNIAYWNLATRRLETGGAGYRVDGRPLRFFHFSGFDPLRPRELSKHQNRIEVGADPALERICAEYAEMLLENGAEESRAWPYGWAELPNGVRLDGVARRLHREARASGALAGSVFERRGAKRFLAYLNERPKGGAVSRYARGVWESRADLRQAFPQVDGRDAGAFERWLAESAGSLGISPLLLAGGETVPASPPAPAEEASPEPPHGGDDRYGVNLAGYLSSERGVGEAARMLRAALGSRGLPVAPIDIPVDAAELPGALGDLDPARHPFDINVFCVNADMLPAVAGAASPRLFEGSHSAGLWFWEIERFPERWRGSFDFLDEVWTASEFVAEALRPLAPVPVTTVRVPVAPEPPAELDRAALGMPDGFCFLFVFDYRSVFRRKNPLGAVEAFTRAFEPGEGASLLIKSVGAEDHPEHAAQLAAAAAAHPDVHLLDGVIPSDAKNAMVAACDCYVSLHRSEGLGLTMAEAMYFGKPVIATAYSGNLDFMTPANSRLVDYELREIGEGAAPYDPRARWAEPSVEHAAELMRAAFDDPAAAAALGAAAAESIRATHSPEAAGRVLEERLTEVRRRRVLARLTAPQAAPAQERPLPVPAPAPVPPAADPASPRARVHHLLSFPEVPARQDAGPLRRLLKRIYMRLLRPYAGHQRLVDLSLRDSLDALGSEMVALERRLARAQEATASELGERALELDRRLAEVDRRLAQLDGDVRGACAAQAEELEAATARLDAVEPGVAELEGLRARLDAVEPAAAEAASLRADFDGLAAETREALERERSYVDALRARLDRFAAESEGAIGELRGQVGEAALAASAGAVKPYMADERFAPRSHPALGNVIGFDAGSRNGLPDGYLGFEELFRGPEQMIRERQRSFLPLVGSGPVLDAGCGRGEFLDLLAEAGIAARGVDRDPGMVARCLEKGHEVERRDLLDALEAAAPASLGCIFSAQVIEHLEADQLERFLSLSRERLVPGGRLVLETVNPHCADALKAFWVDHTHRNPLFPETVLALCQLAGFESADAFCPLGDGDWESDRLKSGEYAVVATAGPTA